METDQIHSLIAEYWTWLQSETELRESNGYVEITTPFLDHHNDHVQIYAKRENGTWLLTDDGYAVRDLESSGCDVSTDRRQDLLHTAARRLGVELDGDELVVRATASDFARKQHSLIQAVVTVGDLLYTASANVISIFLEEVEEWLRSLDVRFTESVKFTGRSGYDHHFDFVIPSSRNAPERVVKVVNRPDRSNVERVIMAWNDTKEVRPEQARAVAILNDEVKEPNFSAIEALDRYDVQTIPWSARSSYIEELVA